MAVEYGLKSAGFNADSDLSSSQYFLMKISGADKVDSVSATSDKIVGILQNEPEDTETAEVAYEGISKVMAGSGGISRGDFLGGNSSGKAVTVAASEGGSARPIIGICTVKASADNVGSVLIDRQIG